VKDSKPYSQGSHEDRMSNSYRENLGERYKGYDR